MFSCFFCEIVLNTIARWGSFLTTSHLGAMRQTDTNRKYRSFSNTFLSRLFYFPPLPKQWAEGGGSFKISDLGRLESETLPTYFRHKRFQSLVRQLNFYNFRKVNRERNFWVYKHPLFHRDKPHDLHLLRRRTCPGVDGRKVRPDQDESNVGSNLRATNMVSPVPPDGSSDTGSDSGSENGKSKKRSSGSGKRKSCSDSLPEHPNPMTPDHANGNDSDASKKQKVESFPEYLTDSADKYMRGPSRLVTPMAITCPADLNEQSLLVSKVSKQLEEHAKRAAFSMGKGAKKKVSAAYISDTMKYHALTYDDEIEIFDSARGCVVEKSSPKHVNDEDISDDDSQNNATVISFNETEVSAQNKHVVTAPIEDANIVNKIVSKLLSRTTHNDSTTFVAIASFCMRTDPNDPDLGDKAIQLMSNHADLAHEFCRYQVALSPNNNQNEYMKEMFRGESDETVRGFKTFLLNNLNDILQQYQNDAWNESHDLTQCYNVWFSGVTSSS